MKKYTYSCTTNTIWCSFDYGEVEANSLEEARAKALEKIKYDLQKVNDVLNSADVTAGFKIEMDLSRLEVTLIKK